MEALCKGHSQALTGVHAPQCRTCKVSFAELNPIAPQLCTNAVCHVKSVLQPQGTQAFYDAIVNLCAADPLVYGTVAHSCSVVSHILYFAHNLRTLDQYVRPDLLQNMAY